MPFPVMNCRMLSRSVSARTGPPTDWLSEASKLALNTRVLSAASRRSPERTSTRERIHSEKAITKKRNSVISETASRVSSLWLDNTRSYTCSMYMVGDSINTLVTMLKMPTMRNSRRNPQSTWANSLRCWELEKKNFMMDTDP